MKIILAPDSFKGTFSSSEVIQYLHRGIMKYFPSAEVVSIPIADGGEGTVDAIHGALGGTFITPTVTGPLGEKVRAKIAFIKDTAIIEMAQASGITLIKDADRNPLVATTFGTGQMILEALNNGAKEIIIGIGGSATNDGGIGMAQALGVEFFGLNKEKIGFGGKYLSEIKSFSTINLDKRVLETKISVICDVTNPLTGPRGATYVYGPQKGAQKEQLELLEKGMVSYKEVIQKQLGIDMNDVMGSGAAGGLGAALVAFLNAVLQPGIDTILDLVNFDEIIKDADLVITGEGRIDGQSINGKVPVGIGNRCKNKNVKVIVLAGAIGNDTEKIYDYGIDALFSTVDKPMTLHEVLENSEVLLENAIDRMLRLIRIGTGLNNK